MATTTPRIDDFIGWLLKNNLVGTCNVSELRYNWNGVRPVEWNTENQTYGRMPKLSKPQMGSFCRGINGMFLKCMQHAYLSSPTNQILNLWRWPWMSSTQKLPKKRGKARTTFTAEITSSLIVSWPSCNHFLIELLNAKYPAIKLAYKKKTIDRLQLCA